MYKLQKEETARPLLEVTLSSGIASTIIDV